MSPSDKRKPQYGDIAALFANQQNKANVGVKRKSVYNGLHNTLFFLLWQMKCEYSSM